MALGVFDKSYVVNLPSRSDRRIDTKTELQRVGLGAEFFSAFRFKDPGRFHRVGSRGAYMSHLSILEKASGAAHSVLILQDDIEFVRDVERLSIICKLPANWGIFYGSYNGAPRSGRQRLRKVDPNEELVGLFFCAVNGPVIPRMVMALRAFLSRERDHPLGGPMPIDGAFNVFRRQNPDVCVFAAVPGLGHQRPSRSDCSDPKWFDTPWTGSAVSLARSAKAKMLQLLHR